MEKLKPKFSFEVWEHSTSGYTKDLRERIAGFAYGEDADDFIEFLEKRKKKSPSWYREVRWVLKEKQ